MSFTYDGDPASSELEEIRFYIGDTDSTNQFASDEELQFLIDKYYVQYGHPLGVAALAAEMLAAKFAREVDASADGVAISIGQLQQRFNDLAQSLRDQYRALNIGGSMDSLVIDPFDPTIDPLVFGVGFMDNAEAGLQDMGRVGNYPVPEY